jgi:formylmethanofuran dehydrogenase subunit E-like metal-binding protein
LHKLGETAIQQRKPRIRPLNAEDSFIVAAENEPEEAVITEVAADKDIQNETAKSAVQATSELKQKEISSVPEIPISSIPVIESPQEDSSFKDEKHLRTENENYDEVMIGEYKIQLAIPKDILRQVKLFNRASANKSAGFWAAKIIKNNPQLTSSPLADPVYIWNEIKDNILKKIAV